MATTEVPGELLQSTHASRVDRAAKRERSPLLRTMKEAWIVARYEHGRLAGGLRARIALAVLPFVTVLPVAVGAIRAERPRPAVAIEQARQVALAVSKWYSLDVARHLFDCPPAVIRLVLFTTYLTPLLTFALAYDCLSGDTQRQTLRLLTVRGARESIVLGKAAAASFLFGVVIVVSHAIVWGVDIVRKQDSVASVLGWGACAVGVCWIAGAANVGLWVFLSSLFARAKSAMFAGFGCMFLLGAVHAVTHGRVPTWDGLTPASVDLLLLSGSAVVRWKGIAVATAWCVATLVGASARLRARDL